jgi:hypothetical protein
MRRGQGQQDSCTRACSKIFVTNEKIQVGVNINAMRVRTKRLGYRGESRSFMAIPYKKDRALCSPTSALEKERMLSEELRNPD